jgi:hypothetical protein
VRLVAVAVVTLALQRLLGWPGFPAALSLLLLPAVCGVAPVMRGQPRRMALLGGALGLASDLVMSEPVIGPGGIAWSAAAALLATLAALIADRRPRTWAGMGAIVAVVVLVVHHLALRPLGLAPDLGPLAVVASAVATGLWCGLVGWVVLLDLPARWVRYRARRLR